MLIENTKGNYSFLKGSAPYSAGVVASAGFRIEHARLSKPLPIAAAFERIDTHLKALGRPSQALCAMELRSPKPYSFQGFGDFNAGYVKFLEKRDIPVNGLNPVARTNVAPEIAPPSEPVIYACSYTVPSRQPGHSFVVAGAGELPEGTNIDPHDVIRRGETSPDALLEKAKFVLGLMDGRVKNLGMKWDDVTTVDVYTIHNIHPFLAAQIVPKVGNAHHGITWHYTRPPITSIEFEMDVRGCPNEVVIAS